MDCLTIHGIVISIKVIRRIPIYPPQKLKYMSENHATRNFAKEFSVGPDTKLRNIITDEIVGTLGEALRQSPEAARSIAALALEHIGETQDGGGAVGAIPRQIARTPETIVEKGDSQGPSGDQALV